MLVLAPFHVNSYVVSELDGVTYTYMRNRCASIQNQTTAESGLIRAAQITKPSCAAGPASLSPCLTSICNKRMELNFPLSKLQSLAWRQNIVRQRVINTASSDCDSRPEYEPYVHPWPSIVHAPYTVVWIGRLTVTTYTCPVVLNSGPRRLQCCSLGAASASLTSDEDLHQILLPSRIYRNGPNPVPRSSRHEPL